GTAPPGAAPAQTPAPEGRRSRVPRPGCGLAPPHDPTPPPPGPAPATPPPAPAPPAATTHPAPPALQLDPRSPLPEKNKAGPAGRATTRGDPPPRGDAATPPRPRPPHHPPAPQPVTPHAPPTPEHTNDTAPAPPQAPNRQTSRPAPPDEDERTSNPGPCTTGSPCCLFLAAASWRPRSENFGQAPIPARYPTAGYTLSNDESRGGRPDVETVVRPDRHPRKPVGPPADDPGPGRP